MSAIWTPDRAAESAKTEREARAAQCKSDGHSAIVACYATRRTMCSACFEHDLKAHWIAHMHKICPIHDKPVKVLDVSAYPGFGEFMPGLSTAEVNGMSCKVEAREDGLYITAANALEVIRTSKAVEIKVILRCQPNLENITCTISFVKPLSANVVSKT